MKTIFAIVIMASISAIATAQDGMTTMPLLKAAPASTLYIAPTTPGTPFQDFTKPGLIVTRRSDGTAFAAPTTPGTPFQDFSKPGYIIKPQ